MTAALRDAAIISGIGESAYTEGGGRPVAVRILDACREAIADAGLAPSDVDGVVGDSHHLARTVAPGELSELAGLELSYTSLFEGGGGAANVGCPLLAAQAIATGQADHVLCYFGTDYATQRQAAGPVEGGPYTFHTDQSAKANFEVPFGWVTQPVYLAGLARRHMHEYGTTTEHLGAVATQTRANARCNEQAIKRAELTMAEYLSAPPIADPFRIYDCCLISDGAGAYVLSSADYAADVPGEPVSVRGVGVGYNSYRGSSHLTQQRDYTTVPATKSGPRAFEMAGLGPDDVDFAELYDCFTIMVPVQLEDLGFCPKGEGGTYVRDRGITVADGDLPVNTHGGLLSQAYLHGINHVVEAVRQLRGEADAQVPEAETGLVTGWGDRVHSTLLLGRGGPGG